MVVLGVSVGFPSGPCPVVVCVVLDGAQDDPKTVENRDLKTSETVTIDQIEDLSRKLSSKLSAIKPDAVVIRVADVPPRTSKSPTPKYRLMIEGALGYVCRVHGVELVHFRSGKEIGLALGLSKEQALASVAATHAVKYRDAAAAALSALPAPTSAQSQ